MKRTLVQYRVAPDRAEENLAAVRRVFEELRRDAPPGLRYATFVLEDGVTFLHLVSVEADPNPLTTLQAFQAFVASVRERCVEGPVARDLHEVGAYRVLEG